MDSPFPARLALAQSSTEDTLLHQLAAEGVRVERERELVDCVDDGAGVTAVFRRTAGLRGPRHALLILAGEADEATRRAYVTMAGELMADFGVFLSAHVIVVGDVPPAIAGAVAFLADPELAVHGRLGAVADTAYVVRPDGYLAYRGEPPAATSLAAFLRAFLRGTSQSPCRSPR